MCLSPENLSELGGLSELSVAELTERYCYCCVFRYPGRTPPPPAVLADPSGVRQAVALLFSAKKPLIIVGKGETNVFILFLIS